MVSRALSVIALAGLLAGCGDKETIRLFEPVEVKVPVPVKAAAPAELLQPYRGVALPDWHRPGDAKAAVCTSVPGANNLLGIISDLRNRDAAWREWAATPLPAKP